MWLDRDQHRELQAEDITSGFRERFRASALETMRPYLAQATEQEAMTRFREGARATIADALGQGMLGQFREAAAGIIGRAGEAYRQFAELEPTEQRARVAQRLVGDPLGRVGEAFEQGGAITADVQANLREMEAAGGPVPQLDERLRARIGERPSRGVQEEPHPLGPRMGAPTREETIAGGAGWEEGLERWRAFKEQEPVAGFVAESISPLNFPVEAARAVAGAAAGAKGLAGAAGLFAGGVKRAKGAGRAGEAGLSLESRVTAARKKADDAWTTLEKSPTDEAKNRWRQAEAEAQALDDELASTVPPEVPAGAARAAEGMPPEPPRPPAPPVEPPMGGGPPPAGLGLPPPGGTVPPGRGAQVNTILNQMYARQPQTIGLPNLPKAVDGFIVRWVNRNMPLERIEELAGQVKAITNDTLLADEMAAELRMVNSSGVAERRLAQQFSPVLQEVDARGGLPNLRNYLTFRQNIDAANALGNPNRMASGGITPTDSYAGLQHLEQTLGPQAYAQLKMDAGKVQDFVRSIWDRKLGAGLITQELHDMLATRYPYFVPTRILDYIKEADSTLATGGKLTINSNMVKKYTVGGTAKAREDPLESIRKYEIETEALAAKNEAFNAFLRLRDIIPGADQIFKSMPNGYKATRDELVVHGYVNGVKQTVSVPIDLQRALDWESHAPIPFIATAVNLFKALATSRNPAFLAANALNDFRSYVTRATMREGGPYPQNIGKVIGALIDAYSDAFKGLGTSRYGPKTEHMLSTGAGQGGFFQGSDKALDDLIRPHALVVKNKGDLLRILTDVVTLKPVETLGKRIELAPRVAQHQLAERRGMEWPAAMKQARSVTMDFQVGGDLGMLFNQFIPFFNVGIQAPAQVVRAFRENRRAFVATGAALIAGPALAAEAWNRSDPQRAKDYDDKPDYVKDMGTLIMLPRSVFPPSVDKEGNPHPQAVFIPGREWQVIANITREAAGRALGADPRSWADLFGGSMKTLAPVQGSNVGEIAAGLTVPGLSTAAQVGFFNRDPFTGNMIATKRNDERAAPLSKAVAGVIGARPSQVEYTIRDLTSGVGGMVLGASELATGTPSPNAGAPQAAPVVGGMVSRFLKGNIGQKLETAQQNIVTGETRAILREAGITSDPGPVGRSIDGVPLTIAEQTEYQQLFNREFNKALAPLAKSVSWKKARPEDKQGYIEYLSDRIRSDIRGYIKYKGGEAFLRRGYAAATGQAAGR